MKRSRLNRRTPMRAKKSRLGNGKWKRKPSRLWTSDEAESLPISKGITDRIERDEERARLEFERKYGSLERVLFIKHALVCIVVGCWRRDIECAHGDDGKEGAYKAGYLTINPICSVHHRTHARSYHNLGSQAAFEREWLAPEGLTWAICAADTEERWRLHGSLYISQAKADGRYDKWAADYGRAA